LSSDLATPFRGKRNRARLTSPLAKLRGGAGDGPVILDFAGRNAPDHDRQPYRVGGALLSVGAFRHRRPPEQPAKAGPAC